VIGRMNGDALIPVMISAHGNVDDGMSGLAWNAVFAVDI